MRAIAVTVLLALSSPGVAYGKGWIWEDPETAAEASPPIRLAARASLWLSNYDRPSRACDPSRGFVNVASNQRALRIAQEEIPDVFCPNDDSDETGIGAGLGAMFRVAGPFHLTVGADVLYTSPEFFVLKPQIVVAVPFGLQVTWPEWTFRPLFEFLITPVLYLTDDARDYTLGGQVGFAYRVRNFGDLALSVGYQSAATLTNWSIAFSILPV